MKFATLLWHPPYGNRRKLAMAGLRPLPLPCGGRGFRQPHSGPGHRPFRFAIWKGNTRSGLASFRRGQARIAKGTKV